MTKHLSRAGEPAPQLDGGKLHCTACGQIRECDRVEVLEFTQRGWPKCCGETMTYSGPTNRQSQPSNSDGSDDRGPRTRAA